MLQTPALWEFKYPHPTEGPYLVRVWVGSPYGRSEIVGMEMWGVEPKVMPWVENAREEMPDVALSTLSIRLPLARILDSWKAIFRGMTDTAVEVFGHEPGQREAADAFRRYLDVDHPAVGRKRITPEDLAEVATVYRRAVAGGDHKPAKAVANWAAAQGRPIADSTARSWVRRAAEMGLLPKGKPGKVRTEEES